MTTIPDPATPHVAYLSPYFFALHIAGGHIGLPILILTFIFSKEVVRHPALINFCITWIIYSISFSIRLYQGMHQNPNIPGPACRIQAILIHGAPPLAAVASLIVVIQVWSALRYPRQRPSGQRWPHRTWMFFSLSLPYFTFIAFCVWSTILLYRFPESLIVSNTGFYCTIHLATLPGRQLAVPTFCTSILVIVLGFEIAIGIQYLRSWRKISRVFPMADRQTSPSMCFRIGVFNAYSIITLCAGIFFMCDQLRAWPYMIQAALPLVAVIVFGTHKDLFLAWSFWKTRNKLPFCHPDPVVPSAHSLDTVPSRSLTERIIRSTPLKSAA